MLETPIKEIAMPIMMFYCVIMTILHLIELLVSLKKTEKTQRKKEFSIFLDNIVPYISFALCTLFAVIFEAMMIYFW